MSKYDKNFDGLDIAKLSQEDLIGVTAVADKNLQGPNFDLNIEDSEGVLPDDFADVFQAAIKNIISASKNLSGQEGSFKNGGDIFLDLAVKSREAQKGGYIPLEYQRYIFCSQCENKNVLEAKQCPKCEGVGRVIAHRRVEIRLPKNVEGGAVLRVASEGHAPSAGSGQASGDLFVKVVIREEV